MRPLHASLLSKGRDALAVLLGTVSIPGPGRFRSRQIARPFRRPGDPGALGNPGCGHDHLPVRDLPHARRPHGLVRRQGSRGVRRVRRTGAGNDRAGRCCELPRHGQRGADRARRPGQAEALHRPDPGGRRATAARSACRSNMARIRFFAAPPPTRASLSAGSSGSRTSSARLPVSRHRAPLPGFKARQPAAISVADLLKAWTVGDTGAFSTMLAGFETKAPVAYRMLIADRNANGASGSPTASTSPERCSSRSARAISRARTASRHWLAARGIATHTRSAEPLQPCQFAPSSL